jgi:hypothetical protein
MESSGRCTQKRFMARYFFNLYNDMEVLDPEGRDLPSIDDARAAAVREARQMMQEAVANGKLTLSDRIEVADEAGVVLLTVTFRDAVAVEG